MDWRLTEDDICEAERLAMAAIPPEIDNAPTGIREPGMIRLSLEAVVEAQYRKLAWGLEQAGFLQHDRHRGYVPSEGCRTCFFLRGVKVWPQSVEPLQEMSP